RVHVVWRIYPGRPNYESVKRGDHPDTTYVLRLNKPLCTVKSDEGEARGNVSEVQLLFLIADVSAIKASEGKDVMLQGTLEEWTLGWHHLPVLFHIRISKASGVAA